MNFTETPDRVEISVTNSGSEIEKDHLPLVFDRFYKGSNGAFEGTGIGLALVKELIAVLKGEVMADSGAGDGTTFRVSLPLGDEYWENITEQEVDHTLAREKRLSEEIQKPVGNGEERLKELILIVEDNAEMREYIQLLLQDEYRLIQAENGAEGIELVRERIPGLIICDAMMLVMDGYAFSKTIKEHIETSHVPIVMLTAKTSKTSRIESYEQGVDIYLTKPFDTDELKEVLKTLRVNRKCLQRIYNKEVVDLKPDEIRVSSKEKLFLEELKNVLNCIIIILNSQSAIWPPC